MAAAGLTSSFLRPSARLATAGTSGRHLSSTAHLSQQVLLQPVSRSAAASSRERTPLQVAAFQIPSGKWWLKNSPPNVVHINSVQHLVDELAGAGERLVIVDVFAPWCAACKALYPKLMKMMEERPDILLLAVNFDENKAVVKAMGVKVLPWFMFFRGKQGKLQEFSASAKKLNLIQEAIERHSTDRCFLSSTDDEPVLKEFPNVVPAKGIQSSSRSSNQPAAKASEPQAQPVA